MIGFQSWLFSRRRFRGFHGHAVPGGSVFVEVGGQVGGGKVYSYRLIDFIDPDYRTKELLQHIRPQDLSGIEIPSTLLPPNKDEYRVTVPGPIRQIGG